MLTMALLMTAMVLQSRTVDVVVDTNANVHAISPLIYGSDAANWNGRGKYLTLIRSGGNRLTAYNWVNNASNAGTDWYNQNDDLMGGGNVPLAAIMPGVNDALRRGSSYLVTIPMQGHVAADKNGGGDVNQTTDYIHVRFRESDSTSPLGANIWAAPDQSANTVYQDACVAHIVKERIDSPGRVLYDLDNEPDLWASTHPRIQLSALTYADLLAKTIDYASMIKRVDHNGLVFGPVSYGWNGYTSLQNAPDANGRMFLDFYLKGMQAAGKAARKRLLDVLDLHYYSEAQSVDNVRVVTDVSDPHMVAARVQAPRSLYDPTYTENSWIAQYSTNGPMNVIPRFMKLIAADYPGTKLAFSEHNFGGSDISGGVAEADALGAFGREGVFAACLWPSQADMGFIYGAWDMYLNYDGHGARFGDTSVSATTSDIARVSVWASKDTKRRGTFVMLINRAVAPTKVSVLLRGKAVRSAVSYHLTAASNRPVRVPGVTLVAGGRFAATLPPMSVTLYVAQ